MKRSIYLLGTLLTAAITIAAVPKIENDPEKIKVTVVHYADGHATVMDTSFEANSDYSVEQFLLDQNLDPEKTEIIDTDAFDGKYTIDHGENSFLFMRESDFEKVQIDVSGMDEMWLSDDMDEDIRIEVEQMIADEMEAVEEIVIEKLENEEIVKDGFVKEVVIIRQDGDEKKTVIRRQTPDDEEVVEEVIIEEPGKVIVIEGGEEREIDINQLRKEVEEQLMQEGINFETLKEMEWEEKVRLKEIEEIEREAAMNEEAEHGKRRVIVHSVVRSHDLGDSETFERPEYTVAMVSRIGGESDASSFIADPAELPIEGPSFFPNPTEGKFRLEFFLPEHGQTQIQVFDMQGREVFTENLGNFQGAYKNDIDISDLNQGAYILNITQNNLRLAEKIIVN